MVSGIWFINLLYCIEESYLCLWIMNALHMLGFIVPNLPWMRPDYCTRPSFYICFTTIKFVQLYMLPSPILFLWSLKSLQQGASKQQKGEGGKKALKQNFSPPEKFQSEQVSNKIRNIIFYNYIPSSHKIPRLFMISGQTSWLWFKILNSVAWYSFQFQWRSSAKMAHQCGLLAPSHKFHDCKKIGEKRAKK